MGRGWPQEASNGGGTAWQSGAQARFISMASASASGDRPGEADAVWCDPRHAVEGSGDYFCDANL
uniref:Uncharacterized protein n=1 Tax=Leersia perrieri TaxID=77586 RepID=A0A0D9WS12_9ORYZ